MIVGDLQNWGNEKNFYHAAIGKGLDYIINTDINALSPGRYEIQGNEIFALIQETLTKPIEEKRPESHARYIYSIYIEGSKKS